MRSGLLACLFAAACALPAAAYHKIIVVDKSGSMREPDVPGSTITRYEKAKSMVLEEVAFDVAGGRNRVDLLFFDHNIYSLRTVRSLAEARLALDSHPPKGETNIGDTLVALLDNVIADSDETYFAVSLYTDGEEKLSEAAKDQVTTIPRAKAALVEYFSKRQERLFLSIYHHRWNSQANKDFSELLAAVARESKHNTKVTIWIEENPDPSKRVRFVGVFPSLASEKIFVERPREGANVEVDLDLSYEATELAIENGLVFRITPVWKGSEAVRLKIDGGSDLAVDRASGRRDLRLVVNGVEALEVEQDYEIVLEFALDENRTDDLFLKRIESREYVLRLVPPEMYLTFRLTPTPFFTLVSPRDRKVADEARVGRTVYHPLELAWNAAARGQRVEWSFTGGSGVRLVDAARQDVPRSFELASGTGEGVGRYFIAARLDEPKALTGRFTLQGTGRIEALSETVDVALAPRVGSVGVVFLDAQDAADDREPRKAFPGTPVESPLSVHLTADADAVGERFRIAARAPDGVTVEVLDNFGRPVTGELQAIDDAGLVPYGLRLTLDPSFDAAGFDPGACSIEFLPEHPDGLQFRPGSRFPFPFDVVAPERDFQVSRLGESGTALVKKGSAGTRGLLQVVWTEDANRRPFDLAIAIDVRSPTGGSIDGLEFTLDGTGDGRRSRTVGGAQPARWEVPWTVATTRVGEWIVEVSFATPGMDGARTVRIPVRSVVGQVRILDTIAATRAVPAGTRTPIGRVFVEGINRFAGGERLRFRIESADGVEIRLVDVEGNPVVGDALDAPDWEGASDAYVVEVRQSYEMLTAAIDPAVNRIVFEPIGPSLVLAGPRDEAGDLVVPLTWTADRPVLTHRTGELVSGEVDLGRYLPEGGVEFDSEKGMTLHVAAGEEIGPRVRAETVRLEWAEWERTSVVEKVVFVATGQAEATVAQLEEDARLRVVFKKGVERNLMTDQPVQIDVDLASDGPVRFENERVLARVVVPSRLSPVGSLAVVAALVVVVFLVVRGLGGGGASGTLEGGLARPGADPVRLDGLSIAYLSVGADRLVASSRKSGDAWARIVPRKGSIWIEPMSGSVTIGGTKVAGRAQLVDGTALDMGPLRVTYVSRAEERAIDEVDLSPRRQPLLTEVDEGGIDLGARPRVESVDEIAASLGGPAAAPQEDLPPPPPDDDDDEGISL